MQETDKKERSEKDKRKTERKERVNQERQTERKKREIGKSDCSKYRAYARFRSGKRGVRGEACLLSIR